MLLVSTTIHRGGHRQQHQWELQHHSPSPGISLQPRSYSVPHCKRVSTVTPIITALLIVFLPPSQQSGAQLTLAEALTHMQTGTVFVRCRGRKNLCRTATAPSSSSPSSAWAPFLSDKGTACQGTGKHTLNTRKYRIDCSRKGIKNQVRSSMVASVRRALRSLILAFHFHCHIPIIKEQMPHSVMVAAQSPLTPMQTLVLLILICNYIY